MDHEQSQKDRVRAQFGASSDAYATSDVHARGESLDVLLANIECQSDWLAVDIATGAGHTALAFAPAVQSMIASDITEPMLTKTMELANQYTIENLSTCIADAEVLPFDDQSVDLLLCRLAFHHFPNPTQAISEMARVARPGAILGFTDNFCVSDQAAAAAYNHFEQTRDPSHVEVYPRDQLVAWFSQAGFQLEFEQCLTKEFAFRPWADRQHCSKATQQDLLQQLDQLADIAASFLKPRTNGNETFFTLHEIVLVGRKSQPSA